MDQEIPEKRTRSTLLHAGVHRLGGGRVKARLDTNGCTTFYRRSGGMRPKDFGSQRSFLVQSESQFGGGGDIPGLLPPLYETLP